MADSSSSILFDVSGLRYVGSSVLNIPSFMMGFFRKGLSSNVESVRSPTSTLDFGLSSIANPFSVRCPRPSCQGGDKQWNNLGVGLGIVNSLVDETVENGSPEMKKNIVFGLEVKGGFLKCKLKSHSLPKNYMISPHSGTSGSKSEFINYDKSLASTLATSLSETSLRNEEFGEEDKTLPTIRGLEVPEVPLPIGCGKQYARSLSARDIELSEDYTCIISHGPNPKTTHIFGDCILECHTKELPFASENDQPESFTISPNILALSVASNSDPADKILNFCYSCKKKIEQDSQMYIYSDKAFCSFDCRHGEIMAEEEQHQTGMNFSDISSNSYHNEDLFPAGVHFAV